MRFSVYFERILNRKMLFSIRNNDIIDARMLGSFESIYAAPSVSFKSPFLTAKLEM